MGIKFRQATRAQLAAATPDNTTIVLLTDAGNEGLAIGTGGLGGKEIGGAGSGVSDGDALATGLTFPNAGLKIEDTNASHALTIVAGSDLTAARTLTIAAGDANRTLDISAGDVTVTAAGAAMTGAASAAAQRAIIESAAPSVVTVTTSTTLTKAAHQGKLLYCTTGALSLTVDNSTDFDAYASCEIVNKTGAVVTIVATATVNRIGSKPLTLPANGRATLMAEAGADTYLLTGEMA